MKLIKLSFSVLIITILSFCSGNEISAFKLSQKVNPDTIFISYPKDLKFFIPRKHQYHQTLTIKLFMSQALFDGKVKRKDNGKSEVFLNYKQALDVIRRIDNLTLGIPKIIYLVGWQYNGHDSKYPAWFEGNDGLKRPQDANSLESMKWLMKEAGKYHATVSLHINMLDAYEDSPLWGTYVKNDIIAKNADGTLRACEWGYPISYAQEWKTGFTQKRIDSLCTLLPIQKAGTIHIDAFHSWPPVLVFDADGKYHIDLTKSVISPYLKFTVQEETEAQRNIFRYWASKGIDVTCEGVDFLRETAFEGFQSMAWWYDGLDKYLKWPASYYCGGQDNSEWGKLFGTSMHGEDLIKKDPKNLTDFKEQFCLNTAVWYYLNRLNRLYVLTDKEYKAVQFSENVRSFLSKDLYKVTKGESILVENSDVLIPAFWLGENKLIAYSKSGYVNKSWTLPENWEDVKEVKLSQVNIDGKTVLSVKKTQSGKLFLTLAKDEMILIEKELIK
jgi:hypothetical protein